MACITKKRGRLVVDFYDQHGKRRLKTLTVNQDAAKRLDEAVFGEKWRQFGDKKKNRDNQNG